MLPDLSLFFGIIQTCRASATYPLSFVPTRACGRYNTDHKPRLPTPIRGVICTD